MHMRTLHVSQHCLYENCKKKKNSDHLMTPKFESYGDITSGQ